MFIIAALGSNNCIGIKNELPWYCPEDLEFFKSKTLEVKDVIVGRGTYSTLPSLPGRNIYVLTRSMPGSDQYTVLRNFQMALSLFRNRDVAIIGGADVYSQFLPHVDTLYLTRFNQSFDGDAFFPDYKQDFKLDTVIKRASNFEIGKWVRK